MSRPSITGVVDHGRSQGGVDGRPAGAQQGVRNDGGAVGAATGAGQVTEAVAGDGGVLGTEGVSEGVGVGEPAEGCRPISISLGALDLGGHAGDVVAGDRDIADTGGTGEQAVHGVRQADATHDRQGAGGDRVVEDQRHRQTAHGVDLGVAGTGGGVVPAIRRVEQRKTTYCFNFGMPETPVYSVVPLADADEYGLAQASELYAELEQRMRYYTNKVEVVEYLD